MTEACQCYYLLCPVRSSNSIYHWILNQCQWVSYKSVYALRSNKCLSFLFDTFIFFSSFLSLALLLLPFHYFTLLLFYPILSHTFQLSDDNMYYEIVWAQFYSCLYRFSSVSFILSFYVNCISLFVLYFFRAFSFMFCFAFFFLLRLRNERIQKKKYLSMALYAGI